MAANCGNMLHTRSDKPRPLLRRPFGPVSPEVFVEQDLDTLSDFITCPVHPKTSAKKGINGKLIYPSKINLYYAS